MGVLEIDTADYVTLNLAVIDSGLIDLVDVELSAGIRPCAPSSKPPIRLASR